MARKKLALPPLSSEFVNEFEKYHGEALPTANEYLDALGGLDSGIEIDPLVVALAKVVADDIRDTIERGGELNPLTILGMGNTLSDAIRYELHLLGIKS